MQSIIVIIILIFCQEASYTTDNSTASSLAESYTNWRQKAPKHQNSAATSLAESYTADNSAATSLATAYSTDNSAATSLAALLSAV